MASEGFPIKSSPLFYFSFTAQRQVINDFEKISPHSSFYLSYFLIILQSVEYHHKISPSGRGSSWISCVERLQIEGSWWEDHDLADGTLCVLLFFFGSLTLLNIAMSNQLGVSEGRWGEEGRGGVWNFLDWSVFCLSVTSCIASDVQFLAVEKEKYHENIKKVTLKVPYYVLYGVFILHPGHQ